MQQQHPIQSIYSTVNGILDKSAAILHISFLLLFSVFILHSRESKLYRYILDWASALAWELPFSEVSGPSVFHIKAGASH